MRVLVVEDSAIIRSSVQQALTEAGLAVDAVADGRQGLIFAQTTAYDAVVLDIGLPEIDGLTVLATLRHKNLRTPVLLLTARDSVEARVLGLRSGADDYLIKPFALAELIARVRALIRRGCGAVAAALTERIRIGTLVVDTTSQTASVIDSELAASSSTHRPPSTTTGGSRETLIDLTPREFALLECLALQAGKPVTRARLEEHLYADDAMVQSNAVDAAVYNLRAKLKAAGLPELVHTRRGIGYVLRPPEP